MFSGYLISMHLVSGDIGNFGSRLSFQKCLYNKQLWKIEIVSPSRVEGEDFLLCNIIKIRPPNLRILQLWGKASAFETSTCITWSPSWDLGAEGIFINMKPMLGSVLGVIKPACLHPTTSHVFSQHPWNCGRLTS